MQSQVYKKIKEDWDRRARKDPLWYADSACDINEFRKNTALAVRNLLRGLPIEKDMVVLEIGCGPGGIIFYLAPIYGEIVRVDVSPEMLRIARIMLAKYDNISLHQNDGSTISMFRDDCFDLILSQSVFQHCPKAVFHSYVKESFRTLRNGGIFRFQMIERYDLFNPRAFFRFHLFNPIFWHDKLRRLQLRRDISHLSPKLECTMQPDHLDTWKLRHYTRSEIENALRRPGFIDISFHLLQGVVCPELYVTCRKV